MRVRELARRLEARFEGDGEKEVTGLATVESAGPGDLSFIYTRKAAKLAEDSKAGCLIVPRDYDNSGNRTVIRAESVRLTFARAIGLLRPAPAFMPGVHATSVVEVNVELGPRVSVGPHASIGEDSKIGAGTRIGAGCRIGRAVVIGEDCLIHAGVSIYDDVSIGRGVVLHSGAVIGADGFGFVPESGRWEKFPQIGRVEIGDFVEIGANSCVDRAAIGVTSIGEGAKLDNMVHVGHNSRIGRHVVVAAQTGFSGGVVVEDGAVIGGQVGIGDKARIESGAVLGSGCGILSSKIVRAGEVVWGTPARPLRKYLVQLANLARLPQLREEVQALKERVAKIER